jgi:phenylacetic acid degradation operon negative regulatory protein
MRDTLRAVAPPKPTLERRAASDPARRQPPVRIYLYSLLGEYVVPGGGSAWTETFVDALELVGVKEKAARQAIARLAAEGMIVSERHGRRVRWTVTERGLRWLAEGRSRSIRFHEPADASIGNWLVLLVSLSDEQRDLRYHLNRRLVSLGWGSIGAGMWLNSGAVPEEAVLVTLRRLGLDETATMMRAEFRPPTRVSDLVDRAWDLDALGARYRTYLAEHELPEPATDAEAFARRTRLVADFNHLFWTDPRLPAELLPADWPGAAVMELVRHGFLDWRLPAARWWASRSRA